MNEVWAPIPGRSYYEASTLGRIRSVDRKVEDSLGRLQFHRGVTLRPAEDNRGYMFVNIRRTSPRVHWLVLETFVGPRPDGLYGCHWDGDRKNNTVENLRWATPSDNQFDRVRHGRNHWALLTHCSRGHELAEPNLVASALRRRGHRSCLACSRASWRHRGMLAGGARAEFKRLSDLYYAEIMIGVTA